MSAHTKKWVQLPDGRHVYGRYPGTSGVTLLEHRLRDDLARKLGGVTEAVLPYGRPDVLTASQVIEVEPLKSWRHGVRQVLAYSQQTDLPPVLALFGRIDQPGVLRLYLKLRDGHPAVELWWHGFVWQDITSRRACRSMPEPEPLVRT